MEIQVQLRSQGLRCLLSLLGVPIIQTHGPGGDPQHPARRQLLHQDGRQDCRSRNNLRSHLSNFYEI